MQYSSIDIIFNPNSTGPSGEMAKRLHRELKKLYPSVTISLRATKHAGHAQEIAYARAKASKHPLLISASGDGGYNEVINGAMEAQKTGARPACAVLPTGNANDHSRTLHDTSLLGALKSKNQTNIDLLKCSFVSDGQTKTRYAHSYIGLGLTPAVAVELNKTDLNPIKELWIAGKTFLKFRPLKIVHDNKALVLDSLVFTNIGQMAKVLTIAKNSEPNDGLFEVAVFNHKHKLHLVQRLTKAATKGLKSKKHYKKYVFKVNGRTAMQFDGEIEFADKDSQIKIVCDPKVLTTVV